MDDDWDDPAPPSASNGMAGVAADGGRTFSGGRGYSTKPRSNGGSNGFGNNNGGGGWDDTPAKTDDGWGNNADSNDDPWGSGNNDGGSGGRGRGRGRGRGGRGGRGRGGGRGGRQNDDFGGGDNNDGWGNNDGGFGGGFGGGDEDGNGNDFGGGRGRGGRGRGRGRGGGRGGRDGFQDGGGDNNEDGEEKKPREIYVPPEPTSDENELFSGISSGINFVKYDDIKVQVSGENYPNPIRTFEDSGLRPLVLENIKKSGYNKPTPIQKHSIPIIMAGRDLMACAQTGSGKTAAFLLPIINSLLADQVECVSDGNCAQPQVVIVSPTRELTIQIYEQARKFAYNSIIKVVVTYGGTSTNYQRQQVQKGCHILVATPGRLNDFVKRGNISFASTKFVVLDEADRMLDMGFLPCVEEMMNNESMTAVGERQTLMFSATFPEEIQHLAYKFLHNYIFVAVGIVGGACSDVEQVFFQVDKFKKRNKLLEILREAGNDRTLVFVETKRNADFLATYLSENDIQTTSIHGDRLQREREQALRDFKTGTRNILVATGVAARGLDIKNVKHVINFDLPKSIDEYVHRIGRTGRLGNRGKATSFYDDGQDGPLSSSLRRILKEAGQDVPDWLGSGGGGGFTGSSGFGGVDYRGDDFGQAQPTDEPLEEW